MKRRVLVLGGGVAGLSAAHELLERGCDVTVIEARGDSGGKARSVAVPGTGTGGRPDLPGEHGFRFFPGFYRHLPDTMSRIPFGKQPSGVLDNLVPATEFQVAVAGRRPVILPARLSAHPGGLIGALTSLLEFRELGIPRDESLFFLHRLWVFLTSSDERRLGELENVSWWDFIGAAQRGEEYRNYYGRALTRALVAVRAERGSARTTASTFLQLALDLLTRGRSFDRVLNGPTSDVWIRPWIRHLRASGAHLISSARVEAIRCEKGRIAGVTVRRADGSRAEHVADDYLAAMPLDALIPLVNAGIAAAAPALLRLPRLTTAWMGGLQLYLRRDVPLVHGHTILPGTPWALTVVSQAQFWLEGVRGYGDGNVRGILSICISDWDSPGILLGKPARALTSPEQIRDEVWAQLVQSLERRHDHPLSRADVIGWLLDPSLIFEGGRAPRNEEPLLVNTVGSWESRPEAVTTIANLFLAADFVRTHTDVASMEAANEAARRAVNGVLAASGATADACPVWRLDEPAVFAPLRALDRLRFEQGRPHLGYRGVAAPSASSRAAHASQPEPRAAVVGSAAGRPP
ncbi:MAG: FAD-dependent oxidoreductase [Byssovorax sp.]